MAWICTNCARDKGLKWPEGKESTFHMYDCEICKKFRPVCDEREWNTSVNFVKKEEQK